MGFTVAEELTFPRYGVSAAGCYVTIRATYSHNKAGSHPPMMPGANGPQVDSLLYTLVARYYVYASQEAGLSPLAEGSVMLSVDEVPADPIAAIYEKIKENYVGKTLVDVL